MSNECGTGPGGAIGWDGLPPLQTDENRSSCGGDFHPWARVPGAIWERSRIEQVARQMGKKERQPRIDRVRSWEDVLPEAQHGGAETDEHSPSGGGWSEESRSARAIASRR